MHPWVCSPPTITGESGNDSAWRGDGRHTLVGARLQQSQASPRTAPHGVAAIGRRLPVHASYHRGGVQEWLRTMWWRPRNPLLPGVIACRCAPPTVVGESGNGSVRCGGGRQPSTPTPLRPGEDEVSVRLPLSQASPKIAPCSVAAASNPPPPSPYFQAYTLASAPSFGSGGLTSAGAPSFGSGGLTGFLAKVLGESSVR